MNALAHRISPSTEALLAQIEDLQAEVAYLRSELGLTVTMADVTRLRRRMPLTPQQCVLVLALYARDGKPLTRWQLEERITQLENPGKLVHTVVSQIRRRLGAGYIERVTVSETTGYRLSSAGHGKVRAALEWEPPTWSSVLVDWTKEAGRVARLQERLALNVSAARLTLVLYGQGGASLTRHELRDRLIPPGVRAAYSWVSVLVHQLRQRIGDDQVLSGGAGAGTGYALSVQGLETIRAALLEEPPAS